MQGDAESAPLPLLLSILKNKPSSSIASVVNAATVELTRKLLSTRDFVNIAAHLSDASDVKNLLDFMLYLLRNGCLFNSDAIADASQRARRLMFKIMTNMPVMPRSLFVTGVIMKVHHEYIGGGGFGLVFKGTFKGAPVSLKVLYRTHNNIDFCREALMWRSLNHMFVLPFLGIFEGEPTPQLFVVTPYMMNGTLSEWRKKANRSTSEIEERILEVAQGMEYIHSEGVIHGDLRGNNILLDDDFHVQIADFGLTRHSESAVTQSGVLHYNFAAPELFGYSEDDVYDPADDVQLMTRTQKSDIYAFGCLYYEIHFDAIPFAGIKDIQILRRVSRGERPPLLNVPFLSDEAWKLIHRCWVQEILERPAMKDIVKRMRAWRAMTPTSIDPQISATEKSKGSLGRKRRTRPNQFGTITNPVNEISFNGTVDGSNSLLTTKLLIGYNSGNVSSSPPLHTPACAPPVPHIPSSAKNETKMSIAVDFGTTFSGVAYSSAPISEGKSQQISLETFRKIPTCLLYDQKGRVLAWGLEAKNAGQIHGAMRCEWFKVFLEPQHLHGDAITDPRLPRLPPWKQPIDLIIDFLDRLWEYAKFQITRQVGTIVDLNFVDIWLTVPAAWDVEGRNIMREAAIAAGLVQRASSGDNRWRDRLHIITEHEAAAVHCAFHGDIDLRPSQNFMIFDAGGGTCDLAVYKVIGEMGNLEVAELCMQSSADCGSIFIDLRFRELVKMLLNDHPVHLDSASLSYFVNSFTETDKLTYRGRDDDSTMFHFTCFNPEDPYDPSVGLINGQLCIPGKLLRETVFDPVICQVLSLIEEQIQRMDQPIHVLFLVGGAGSEYLKQRIKAEFGPKIAIVARNPDAGAATLHGAVRCGLSEKQLASSVIAPRSYMMNVKLPAEGDDMLNRPGFIINNNAGVAMCENRLQYLLVKGAIVKKGQRSITKFCKFSKDELDTIFVATIFASDEDKVLRYTDEGKMTEQCKWKIDLASLPAFRQNASLNKSGGFYTDFELGLEMDNYEVRGVLLHNNQEWGWEWMTIDYIR